MFLNSWIFCCCCCFLFFSFFFFGRGGGGGVRGTGGKRLVYLQLFIYLFIYLFTCTCISFMVCISCVKGAIHVHWKNCNWHFALLYSPQSQNHLSWVYLKVIPKYSKYFLFQKVNLNCFINWLNLFIIFVKQVLYNVHDCMIFPSASNQFDFYFPLSQIMVINTAQRKIKIKLVWKIIIIKKNATYTVYTHTITLCFCR